MKNKRKSKRKPRLGDRVILAKVETTYGTDPVKPAFNAERLIRATSAPSVAGLLQEASECMDDLMEKTDVYLGINDARDRASKCQRDIAAFLLGARSVL